MALDEDAMSDHLSNYLRPPVDARAMARDAGTTRFWSTSRPDACNPLPLHDPPQPTGKPLSSRRSIARWARDIWRRLAPGPVASAPPRQDTEFRGVAVVDCLATLWKGAPMDTIEAIRTRRSIRAYADRPVARGLIESVIADAAQAPPAFRGQVPWGFAVIQGAARIAALEEPAMAHARASRTAPPGTSWLDRPGASIFWGAPILILIFGEPADCARAGQNLILSAHARGLGTCWVGSPLPWLRTDAGRQALGMPDGAVPAAVICLGYPAAIPEALEAGPPAIVWVE